jgi:phosphoribosyl-dephospho-CoA transferase
MIGLRRHALVRLAHPPDADNEADRRRAAAWHAAGRPFVVARRGDDASALRLGFCTVDPAHPELRPRRVAARTTEGTVAAIDLPPPLSAVIDQADGHPRRDALAGLRDAAVAQGLDIRVYGSWMWQTLTGERHVHALSDVDVLLDVAERAAAERAAAFLAAQEAATGLTLDGELHLAAVGDLSWRELRQDGPEVLLKSLDGLRLVAREALGQ